MYEEIDGDNSYISFDDYPSYLAYDEDAEMTVEEINQTTYQILSMTGEELSERFYVGEVLNDSQIDDLIDSDVEITFR